jgi:hypothetical protein
MIHFLYVITIVSASLNFGGYVLKFYKGIYFLY